MKRQVCPKWGLVAYACYLLYEKALQTLEWCGDRVVFRRDFDVWKSEFAVQGDLTWCEFACRAFGLHTNEHDRHSRVRRNDLPNPPLCVLVTQEAGQIKHDKKPVRARPCRGRPLRIMLFLAGTVPHVVDNASPSTRLASKRAYRQSSGLCRNVPRFELTRFMSPEKRRFTNASVSNESYLERPLNDFNTRHVSWNECATDPTRLLNHFTQWHAHIADGRTPQSWSLR